MPRGFLGCRHTIACLDKRDKLLIMIVIVICKGVKALPVNPKSEQKYNLNKTSDCLGKILKCLGIESLQLEGVFKLENNN